jgi:hypothetical protein
MAAMMHTLKSFDRSTFDQVCSGRGTLQRVIIVIVPQIPAQCKVRLANEEHFALAAMERNRAQVSERFEEISRNPAWTFSLWIPEQLQLRAEPLEDRFKRIIDKNIVSPVGFH